LQNEKQSDMGIVGTLAVAGVVGVTLQPRARLGAQNGTGTFRVRAKQAQAKASETDAEEKNGFAMTLLKFWSSS